MTHEDFEQRSLQKDRLIQQLAQELIQVNQVNRSLQQTQQSQEPSANPERIAWLEKQLTKARDEIAAKDKENRQLLDRLQQSQQEIQKLQQYLRELPDLYRRKFTERMVPFKQRMNEVELENHRLQQFIQSQDRQLPEAALPLLPPTPPKVP